MNANLIQNKMWSYSRLAGSGITEASLTRLSPNGGLNQAKGNLKVPKRTLSAVDAKLGSADISTVDKDFANYFIIRERFIQRLMKDGKKSIATKIFDESLEIFYQTIQQTSQDELGAKANKAGGSSGKRGRSKSGQAVEGGGISSGRKKSTMDWGYIQEMGKSDLFLAAFFRAKP